MLRKGPLAKRGIRFKNAVMLEAVKMSRREIQQSRQGEESYTTQNIRN